MTRHDSDQPTQGARIVVAHASVGSGHRVAAEAIAAELEWLLSGSGATITLLDAREYLALRVSGDTAARSFTGRLGPIYDRLWSSRLFVPAERRLAPLVAPFTGRLARELFRRDPDAIVCTHALPAMAAARLKRHGILSARLYTVATDMAVHSYWPMSHVDHYFVAMPSARQRLIALGAERDLISVSGVPLRPAFSVPPDRLAARNELGLDPEGRLVTVIAGAGQRGPYARLAPVMGDLVEALARAQGVQAVIVTGADSELRGQLEDRLAQVGTGAHGVRVDGYADGIATLFAASDVVVCKPGGLVTSEALAIGRPMLLVGGGWGQERANVRALTEAGAAISVEHPSRLTETLLRLDVATLDSMAVSAQELGTRGAARTVASIVAESLRPPVSS